MAETLPLLSLRDASVSFGVAPLFTDLSVSLSKGDRVCLVGHNGSGKSTLLKALAGLIEIDTGERFVQPGVRISYLPQDLIPPADATVVQFVSGGETPAHEVAAQLDEFELAGEQIMGTLSGGELRRAALARALVTSPDILLLDEPTNHLDLPTIEQLEAMLQRFQGGWLTVSHDRTFLRNTTKSTLWLAAGGLFVNGRGFSDFEPWSERVIAAEDAAINRIDQHLQAELRYFHRGVTARRRRNQRRLRKLSELRAERARRLRVDAKPKMKQMANMSGGKLVLEVGDITKSYGDRVIASGFSTRVLKGDRVGIIGANGAGKSTIIQLLTGAIAPDEGRVRLADGLRIAYFDQGRQSLDRTLTPIDILCEGGGDTVVVNGHQRHVVAYLSDFLFREHQARSPIGSLSGGEQSRLLLARILIQPSNLLVLDEPTNDLDADTLDTLQERLDEYQGTLLVVSHDRDFLDQLVTSVIALEGDGVITEYSGGYSDYLHQRQTPVVSQRKLPKERKPKPKSAPHTKRPWSHAKSLSWLERQELDALPARVATIERDISALEAELGDPNLFATDPGKFERYAALLAAKNDDKSAAEQRWLELEDKQDAAQTRRAT